MIEDSEARFPMRRMHAAHRFDRQQNDRYNVETVVLLAVVVLTGG